MSAGVPMSFYRRQILPRIMPHVLGSQEHRRLRSETSRGLGGDIVEIGFGAGLNLPTLPSAVRSVHAVDPDVVGRRLARERIERATADVHFAGLDGQILRLDTHSMDGALSTWTLCTVPELSAALAELRRVLKPGAVFHFLEHGLSDDPGLARWQRRLNPVQGLIGGGCRLDVPIARVIAEAGFDLAELDTFTMPGFKPASCMYRGIAVNPA